MKSEALERQLFLIFENHPELDQFYLAFNRASKLKVN